MISTTEQYVIWNFFKWSNKSKILEFEVRELHYAYASQLSTHPDHIHTYWGFRGFLLKPNFQNFDSSNSRVGESRHTAYSMWHPGYSVPLTCEHTPSPRLKNEIFDDDGTLFQLFSLFRFPSCKFRWRWQQQQQQQHCSTAAVPALLIAIATLQHSTTLSLVTHLDSKSGSYERNLQSGDCRRHHFPAPFNHQRHRLSF